MKPGIFKTVLSAFFILIHCDCQAEGRRDIDAEQNYPAEVHPIIRAHSPAACLADYIASVKMTYFIGGTGAVTKGTMPAAALCTGWKNAEKPPSVLLTMTGMFTRNAIS